MLCPACNEQQVLKPTKLDESLPAYSCDSCRGALIDILGYRLWSDRHCSDSFSDKNQSITIEPHPKDSKHALLCPRCSKIMMKFAISGDTENKIDLCGHCGTFWLDGGEWELLAWINLDHEVTRVFTEPWQRKLRQETDAFEEKTKQSLGAEDFDRAKEFKSWLMAHPKRGEMLSYINRTTS